MKRIERVTDVELVPNPAEALARDSAIEGGRVKKRNRRKKGKTISFNEEDLKSYVTGFRKRKLARREHAKKKIAEMEKKAKRIKKKERKERLKAELGMDKYDDCIGSSSESGNEEMKTEKQTYTSLSFKTVVRVEPLHLSTMNNDGTDNEDV